MNKISYKILGIDYGDSRIGIAISDSENRIALPYKIIENKDEEFFVHELKYVCKKESIDKIIVGLPLALSGEETVQTKKVRDVVETLKREFTVPVETEDERMSSKLAGIMVGNNKDDANAAAIILQGYLDRQSK